MDLVEVGLIYGQPVGGCIGEDYRRSECAGFFGRHHGVGHDNHYIANLNLAGGGPVEANDAGIARTGNSVCVEALAVVVVDNEDAFAGKDAGCVHQILIDGDTADVVEAGLGHMYPVNLGFQDLELHGSVVFNGERSVGDIVDQAHIADINGDAAYGIVGVVPVGYGLHGVSVDDREVFYLHLGYLVDLADNSLDRLAYRCLVAYIDAVGEHTVDRGRQISLRGRQAHVAAREGQAVVGTLYRAGHDFNIVETFQFCHASDHGNLLEVFLTEVSAGGVCPAEELAYDLRHAVEVTGTAGAFHHLGYGTKVKHSCVGLGVDLFYRRNEGIVNTGGLKQSTVGFFGAGIGLQVVGVVKLRGVYEDAYHYYIVFLAGSVDKRHVSGMKCAHSGHQADGLAGLTCCVCELIELAHFTNYFQTLLK